MTDLSDKIVAATKGAPIGACFDIVVTLQADSTLAFDVVPHDPNENTKDKMLNFQSLSEMVENFVDNPKVLPGSTMRIQIQAG